MPSNPASAARRAADPNARTSAWISPVVNSTGWMVYMAFGTGDGATGVMLDIIVWLPQ